MSDTIKALTARDEFTEGQWWLQELDAMAATGTDDQKRAVAVVRNLMRQHAALAAQERAEPVARAWVVRLDGDADKSGAIWMSEPTQKDIDWIKTHTGKFVTVTKLVEYRPPAAQSAQPVAVPDERKAFEQWYACNAFDYARDPIGSRDCAIQWAAWQARAQIASNRAMLSAAPAAPKREPLTDEDVLKTLEDEARRLNGGTMDGLQMDAEMFSEVIKIFRIAERAHGITKEGGAS